MKRFSENLLYELFNDWLWNAGTLTYNKLKRLLTGVNRLRCLTNDLSKTKTKPTNGLPTTNNRWIETDQWPMVNSTRVLQPIPWRLYWPITFNGRDWWHHRLTSIIHDLQGLVIHKKKTLARLACLCFSLFYRSIDITFAGKGTQIRGVAHGYLLWNP